MSNQPTKYTQEDVPEDIKNRFPLLSRVNIGGQVPVQQAPISTSRAIVRPTVQSFQPVQTVQTVQPSIRSTIVPNKQTLESIRAQYGQIPEGAQIYNDSNVPEEIRKLFPNLQNRSTPSFVNIPFATNLAQSTIIPQQQQEYQPDYQDEQGQDQGEDQQYYQENQDQDVDQAGQQQ